MPTTRKPRILIIGEAVAPTGFARVIRSIFEWLYTDYDVHQLATRFGGQSHDYPWTLYRADKGKSVYGYDQIRPLIEKIRPNIVFVLYDIPFQQKYMDAIRDCPGDHKVVMYTPVEAGPIAPELIKTLSDVSRYVMFTDYGRKEIEHTISLLRKETPAFDFPVTPIIPHGVDTERFFPLEGIETKEGKQLGRSKARQAMQLDDEEHRDAFIVLNANRNMPRKRIDLTMQGFALFAKDKPSSVKLYLHMATEDTGWNVILLAKRYEIYDRLIMTCADNSRPQFSDEQLNNLYNACDVGLTTTTSEGWGMVSFEHAATGAAQVLPRHTSLAELWDEGAEFIEPAHQLTYPGNLTVGHFVSAEGVAAALNRVYCDASFRNQLAIAGYQNATQADYSWKAVAERWRQLFNEVIEQG